jgi:glyoxylase-like metal-dependent hydrolase (beta-lactamase superfamily II)
MGELTGELVASGAAGARIVERAAEYGIDVPGPPRVDLALTVGRSHPIGPFTVETLSLPGHTPDGTAYRVRELDLLAAGDHLSAAEFPFASSTAEYRTTLATLIDLLRTDPPAHVVPGHGPMLTSKQALAIAEADLAYLEALREVVRAGGAEAGRAVPLPRPAPPDLAEMHAANVEAQLAELLHE